MGESPGLATILLVMVGGVVGLDLVLTVPDVMPALDTGVR